MIDQMVMVAGTLELELMCRLKHFEPTEVLNMWHKALLELPVSAKLLAVVLFTKLVNLEFNDVTSHIESSKLVDGVSQKTAMTKLSSRESSTHL